MLDCQSCERMARAEENIESLERGVVCLEKKLDRLQYWIMTSTAGIVVTLLVLLYQVGR